MKHGDLAVVRVPVTSTVFGEPTVARYTDYDQQRRDAGVDPEDLTEPYWSFFGTDYTERAEDVEVIEVLRLLRQDGQEVRP